METEWIIGLAATVVLSTIGWLIRTMIASLKVEIQVIENQNKKILENQESAAVNTAVLQNQIKSLFLTVGVNSTKLDDVIAKTASQESGLAVIMEWKKHIDSKTK